MSATWSGNEVISHGEPVVDKGKTPQLGCVSMCISNGDDRSGKSTAVEQCTSRQAKREMQA
jgi:hypothetical protein